jgi:hypothetical protein
VVSLSSRGDAAGPSLELGYPGDLAYVNKNGNLQPRDRSTYRALSASTCFGESSSTDETVGLPVGIADKDACTSRLLPPSSASAPSNTVKAGFRVRAAEIEDSGKASGKASSTEHLSPLPEGDLEERR